MRRRPLTVKDQVSRPLLCCEAIESTKEVPVIEAFVSLFRDRCLPAGIRSDNGLPFASPNGLYNLSKLSVWRPRLGIEEVDDDNWRVSFLDYDLGFFDKQTIASSQRPTPSTRKRCKPCLRYVPSPISQVGHTG